jgi:uncharacterized membrane protein/uncharacterized membrane protein YbhN (UPF0104 family)
MDKAKKGFRYFLGFPITIISIVLIAKILLSYRDTITSSITHINIFIFFLGVFFYVIFFLLKSVIWIEILKKRGHQVPGRTAIYYYAVSDIKRYVPGNVVSFLSRITTLSGFVSKGETLKAIGIETVLMVISALIVAIPALYYPLTKAASVNLNFIFLLPIFIVGLFIVLYVLFRKYSSFLTSYLDAFLLFLLAWFVFAIASFFIAASFTYIYPGNILFILSFFVLSWLIGFLSFVTPMGLGVRELAITASLSLFLPVALASVIAVLTRIGMILGELLYVFFAYVFFRLKKNNLILRLSPYTLLLNVGIIFYSFYFLYYTIKRHDAFLSGRFDLGNMSQTVWNTLHGRFLLLTNPDGTEQISRLGIHTDFLLAFFAPFYFLWSDPKMLLIIQTLVVASGAFFVFKIGKLILKNEKLSLLFALSYLLNFWIQEQTIFDFHAVTLATTFLLATFYFMLKRRYFLFSVFLVLSVLTKENVFLVAGIFGLYFIFKEKKWLAGTLLAVVSFGIFFYLMNTLIPHARGNVHFALTYYSYIGDSSLGIFRNLLLKPQLIVHQLFSLSTMDYFHKLFFPTGYLSLLSPLYLIFALPDIAINLLSSNINLRSQGFHYGAIIIPFIYISSIYASQKIIKKYNKKAEGFLFYYLIAVTLLSVYFYSPLPGMRFSDNLPFTAIDYQKIHSYLSIIPENASVSASNSIGAHLSNREKIYVVPNGIKTADYIVLYDEKQSLVERVNLKDYELKVSYKKFYIYQKKNITSCLRCSL